MVSVRFFKWAFLRSNSVLLGRAAMRVFLSIDRKGREVSGLARLVLDMLQPVDPLRGSRNLPAIQVLIPFVLKDIDMLRVCVEGAIRSSKNPVSVVRLITPIRTQHRAPDEFLKATRSIGHFLEDNGIQLSVEFDEDVVPEAVRDYISSLGLPPRYHGWLSAQTVKLFGAMGTRNRATLVIDSDTILSYRRVWVDGGGRQILMVGQESRPSFFNYASEYLKIDSRPRLSFITHHQVMQADMVGEIFPAGARDVIRWIQSAGPRNSDYAEGGLRVAEYELYGAYLDICKPERRVYASWGNTTGVRGDHMIGSPRDHRTSWALSTSFHHYKSRNNTPEELM